MLNQSQRPLLNFFHQPSNFLQPRKNTHSKQERHITYHRHCKNVRLLLKMQHNLNGEKLYNLSMTREGFKVMMFSCRIGTEKVSASEGWGGVGVHQLQRREN